MKHKHTAGPWKNRDGNISGKWEDGKEIGVAMVGITRFCGNESGGPKDIRMKAENKANAELIAAAPELADALELLAEYFWESHAEEVDSDHHGDGPEGCTYCKAIGQAWKALKKAGR